LDIVCIEFLVLHSQTLYAITSCSFSRLVLAPRLLALQSWATPFLLFYCPCPPPRCLLGSFLQAFFFSGIHDFFLSAFHSGFFSLILAFALRIGGSYAPPLLLLGLRKPQFTRLYALPASLGLLPKSFSLLFHDPSSSCCFSPSCVRPFLQLDTDILVRLTFERFEPE